MGVMLPLVLLLVLRGGLQLHGLGMMRIIVGGYGAYVRERACAEGFGW